MANFKMISQMNRFYLILIFIVITLSSCNQSIELNRLNNLNAKDDSLRIAKGLITMKTTWHLDTVEYGLIDSINNIWTEIEDTTKCRDFVIRKRYTLNDKDKTIEKKKIIEFNPKTNIKFNETDIYINFNKKDSLKVDIIYSYNYLSDSYYCTIDTLDLIKQRKADKDFKNLEQKWDKIDNDTTLVPCETAHQTAILKLFKSYLKTKVLRNEEALILIEKFKKNKNWP